MSAIIRVSHLSKQFKDTKAVDDLSFTVNKGDVYGFLGQNGAGKSTTIRMLLSLIAPTEGDITIFDKNYPPTDQQFFDKWEQLLKSLICINTFLLMTIFPSSPK